MSDNGVVHVLNGVVLPTETVADVAINNGFNTLVTAVVAAELLPALTNPFATLTVFAPTDAAFDALPEGVLDGLLADIPALTDVLLYHVVGSVALSTDLSDGQMIETLQGQDIDVSIMGTSVMINESNVTGADNQAGNGVVHIIDAVLIPEPTSVNDNNSISGVSVYPNPAEELAFVEFNMNKQEQTTIRITDLSGKTLYVKTSSIGAGQHRVELPLNGLSKGMYLVELTTNTSTSVNKLSVK